VRTGYGIRAELLAASEPAAVEEVDWPRILRLKVSAFTVPADLPPEIVTSVRCIVEVDDRIVICENQHGRHMWPGGRRKPGETFAETACREVHEETGWLVDPSTIRTIGWLHHEHVMPAPDDHPYPHPDFLHPVVRANALSRAADEWTDTEGYEVSSRLATIDEAHELLEPLQGYAIAKVFLDLLRD
jgi:8-oxo-dGTP pyrophosphatase MutT (NUDIX family)